MVVAGAAGERARQPPSQCGVLFSVFFLSLGAAVHAGVAVVLYKALMTCKG